MTMDVERPRKVAAPGLLAHQAQLVERVTSTLTGRYVVVAQAGSGKRAASCVALREVLARAPGGRALVVTPALLRSQWQQELRRWSEIDAAVLEGPRLGALVANGTLPDATCFVVSAELTASGAAALSSRPWALLIIDEAHAFVGGSRREAAEMLWASKNVRLALALTGLRVPVWLVRDEATVLDWTEQLEHLLFDQDVARVAASMGVEPVPLRDIADAFDLGRPLAGGGFPERTNVFYLPTIGNSAAVSRFTELRNKPQNYMQVAVRPEIALAEYIAAYFSSPLGLRARKRVERGVIPKISKVTVGDALVVIPPMSVQTEALSVWRVIRQLGSDLAAQERKLWEMPSLAPEIAKHLRAVTAKSSFEHWMESLPFPLSSILWQYLTVRATDSQRARKHLLHFFEAATQFATCLLLSAMRSDPSHFEAHKREWFPDPKRRDSLDKPTWGTWQVIGSRLAQSGRSMLSTTDSRSHFLQMFACQRSELANALSSKDLFELFESTAENRNRWDGHGGLETDAEADRRLRVLEQSLDSFRELIGDAFVFTDLVKPKDAEFSGQTFRNRVHLLVGSRPTFRQVVVDTLVPMDSSKTYLVEQGQPTPLPLLPFVKLLPPPPNELSACYFYNRIEAGSGRFVPYASGQEPEREVNDPELLEFLAELKLAGS